MIIPKQKGFSFDALLHKYSFDGGTIMSNTEALSLSGIVDYRFLPEAASFAALKIGSDVAKATELYDKGLPWKVDFDHVRPYVEAWRAFKTAYEFKPLLIEHPIFVADLGYATSPDRYGDSAIGRIIVQMKTGAVAPWVGLQTAAEERAVEFLLAKNNKRQEAINPNMLSSDRRIGLELKSNGSYKATRFTDTTDLKVFVAALTVAKYKRRQLRT